MLQMQSPWTHVKSLIKFSNARPTATITSDQQHRDEHKRIEINATTGELPTVLLGPVGQRKRRFLVDSEAGTNRLKRKNTLISKAQEHIIINLFNKKINPCSGLRISANRRWNIRFTRATTIQIRAFQ